jgi:hypothetical protein
MGTRVDSAHQEDVREVRRRRSFMGDLYQQDIEMLLGAFSDKAESWKVEHAEAMLCRDLEDALVLGIAVHFAISIVDTNWHDSVFSDKVEYDVSDEQAIAEYYREWLQDAEYFFGRLEKTEAAGYQVKLSEQFRRAYREVKGIQIPDSEFFVGDNLVELRDQTIETYLGGHTVEMHKFGD